MGKTRQAEIARVSALILETSAQLPVQKKSGPSTRTRDQALRVLRARLAELQKDEG